MNACSGKGTGDTQDTGDVGTVRIALWPASIIHMFVSMNLCVSMVYVWCIHGLRVYPYFMCVSIIFVCIYGLRVCIDDLCA